MPVAFKNFQPRKNLILAILILFVCGLGFRFAQAADLDSDRDGLSDQEEIDIYHTNPLSPDTDQDGYADGDEVSHNYDPNKYGDDRIQRKIVVNLQDQSLAYFLGPYLIKTFKISGGTKNHPTPKGEFAIIEKKPFVTYKGANYYFPHTRWNMMFKRGSLGNLYIHGAYWHHKFGQPMSHGCVNVSYSDMEGLYNWADLGTKVVIE
jgi:hypothetical protein